MLSVAQVFIHDLLRWTLVLLPEDYKLRGNHGAMYAFLFSMHSIISTRIDPRRGLMKAISKAVAVGTVLKNSNLKSAIVSEC